MRHNKKTIISIALCIGIFFMAVGYSILMTQLKINGSANITSTWDIRITGISNGTSVGSAYNIEEPSFTDTTAKFNVSLVNPGDSMTYTVTIKNNGTLTAILNSMDITTSGTDAIIYEVTGLKEGDTITAGSTKTLTVVARYNSNVIADPSERVKRLKVGLDWVQYINQTITPDTYTISYARNGGSGSMSNTTCTVGSSCTLRSNTFTRSGYEFLGWATTSTGAPVYDNAESVTNLTSGGKTVTLYAAWGQITNYTSATSYTYTVPASGYYKIEAWGAQGGGSTGGKGGYAAGTIFLEQGTALSVYVGGQPSSYTGGYGYVRGGSASCYNSSTSYGCGYGGGGASEVRMGSTRLLVAGGGGGAGGGYRYTRSTVSSTTVGGAGGAAGVKGSNGYSTTTGGGAATLTAVETGGTRYTATTSSSNDATLCYGGAGGGGGAGYRGGGGGASSSMRGTTIANGNNGSSGSTTGTGGAGGRSVYLANCYYYSYTGAGGGGGSNYVSSQFESGTTSTINGNASMPNPTSTSTMTGRSGNGYVRITRLSIK